MLADDLMYRYGASQRQVCAVLKMSRSVYGYRSCARDVKPLVSRIKEITATRVHYGYRRVHVLLRREGWKDNHKRVYRLYRNEGLSLRHKRPRVIKLHGCGSRSRSSIQSTRSGVWIL